MFLLIITTKNINFQELEVEAKKNVKE